MPRIRKEDSARHRCGGRLKTLCAVLLGAFMLSFGMGSDADAQLSVEAVSKKVETAFGVKVLRVKPMTSGGQDEYTVTIMVPGGDRNTAFQVNTIVVNAETGKPVIQYGHAGGRQQWAAPPISHRTHPRLVTDE